MQNPHNAEYPHKFRKEQTMKLLHLADLHIGKRVNEFSMLEDQIYILHQILDIARERRPDGVLIAGDVYDKTIPSAEAVTVLDGFLTSLADLHIPVFVVPGNHDSAERLGFGSHLLRESGVYIAAPYHGAVERFTLEDAYGPVGIHLLPFLRPAAVGACHPEEKVDGYDSGVRLALSHADFSGADRHVLVAHQFVTSGGKEPERSDSEAITVGGLDNVEVSAFDRFDYVALGHIHGPQFVGRPSVRYAGSPLKYSFSEWRQQKTALLVTLRGPGEEPELEKIPLIPLRNLRVIRGPLAQLTAMGEKSQDYIEAVLTDEESLADPLGELRQIYPNLMRLTFDNRRTQTQGGPGVAQSIREKSPLELFGEFYEAQNGAPLEEEQTALLSQLLAGLEEAR